MQTPLVPSPVEVDRYLDGTASADEITRVETWLAAPAETRRPPATDECWVRLRDRIVESRLDSIEAVDRNSLASRLPIRHNEGRARVRAIPTSARRLWQVTGAAAFLGILLLAKPIESWVQGHASSKMPPAREYVTAVGQRATLTLGDGSIVTLAPDTRLQVVGREITLSGEALFTVVHHAREPFLVRAAHSTVRVLGTTFSVRKYNDDDAVRVAVAQGKVMVQNALVGSGEVATDRSGRVVDVTHDAERVLAMMAFAQGRVVMEDVTLAEAIPQLSRWLGLTIQESGAASHIRFSITFDSDEPTLALNEVATLTHTTYTMRGRLVTFAPKNFDNH